ncbi:MAG: dUTP diphosphatase [Gemmatimonadota bacterium]
MTARREGDASGGSTSPEAFLVRFRRLPGNPDLPLPARASEHAAGYDIRSAEEDFALARFEVRLVSTGLALELPEGVECQVRPRSGLAARHGVTLPNSPGTIDPDYRGEVRVLLQNLGPESVTIARGDRIAQLVFARFEAPAVTEARELGETERGTGGFGSTGLG